MRRLYRKFRVIECEARTLYGSTLGAASASFVSLALSVQHQQSAVKGTRTRLSLEI